MAEEEPMIAESQPTITGREYQVLRLAGQGKSDRRIAATLGVAPSTVRNHIASICRKLGALNRFMCGVLAERAGLLHVTRR